LAPGEFIRRFMLHVLPKGFHRIRHYGLLASCRTKAATLVRARELIAAATPSAKMQGDDEAAASIEQPAHPCPCCGARMVIIETFAAGCVPRHRPTVRQLAIRIDTS
jgi:Putative transposase